MQLIDQWELRTRSSSHDLINICLELFSNQESQSWIRNMKEDGLKGSACQSVLELLLNSLLKLFQKRVWIPRCARTVAWEQTKGIHTRWKRKNSKVKEKTPRKEVYKTPDFPKRSKVRRRESIEERNRDQTNTTQSLKLVEKEHCLREKVEKTVWG